MTEYLQAQAEAVTDVGFTHSGLVGEESAILAATKVEFDPSGKEAEERREDMLLQMDVQFSELGISDDLLKGIFEMGFVNPSKIQAAALPYVLGSVGEKHNLLGQAQNGSGKTATFALGLLSAIDYSDLTPQALVVNPTRELAVQNAQIIDTLGKYVGVKTLQVLAQEQVARNAPCHVLVGTPGKILDLTKKRVLNLSKIKVFVLDEADEMLDLKNSMGSQVKDIQGWLPKEEAYQVLFLSATWTDEIRKFGLGLVNQNMMKTVNIEVKKEALVVAAVRQLYMRCSDDWDKYQKLKELYGAMSIGQSVVFVNERKKAFDLAKWLRADGYSVSLICGTQMPGYEEEIEPSKRDKIMHQFRSGTTKILIATDLLSRGVDVPSITLVINYELPNSRNKEMRAATYLHRVGRTGRFGLLGVAVNLVSEQEIQRLEEFKEHFQCSIEEQSADFEDLEKIVQSLRD